MFLILLLVSMDKNGLWKPFSRIIMLLVFMEMKKVSFSKYDVCSSHGHNEVLHMDYIYLDTYRISTKVMGYDLDDLDKVVWMVTGLDPVCYSKGILMAILQKGREGSHLWYPFWEVRRKSRQGKHQELGVNTRSLYGPTSRV